VAVSGVCALWHFRLAGSCSLSVGGWAPSGAANPGRPVLADGWADFFLGRVDHSFRDSSRARRRRADPLSVLQIFRSVVDDPVADSWPAPPARRPHRHHLVRPDRPSSIVAPNRKSLKWNRRRRSAAAAPRRRLERAELLTKLGEPARASRAREGNEYGQRSVSVLRNLPIDCRPPPSSLRSPGAADLSILSPLPRQQPQQTPPSLLNQARAVLYCAT
jgi:hypothetical protein